MQLLFILLIFPENVEFPPPSHTKVWVPLLFRKLVVYFKNRVTDCEILISDQIRVTDRMLNLTEDFLEWKVNNAL